jgi:hypothetical protein
MEVHMSRKSIEKETVAPLARKNLLSRDRGIGQASGQKLLSPRERMWAAMIKLTNLSKVDRTFTIYDVTDHAYPCSHDAVGDYLAALEKAGLAELVAEQGRKANGGDLSSRHWRLLVNWAQAPRINKAGQVVTQGLGVLAMWRAARVRKTFTPNELAADASVGELVVSVDTARQYCCTLVKSGHFAYVFKGKGGKSSTLRLVKDTGPHAPAITKAKVVFDRNEARHIVVDTPQETCDQLG